MSLLISLSLLSALIAPAAAQTWTSCNPLNETNCPSNPALGSGNATFDFTTSKAHSDVWNLTAGNVVYGTEGAEFTIRQKGDAPTIQSNFYMFFGELEVWMKPAPGQGVVSSVVLQSDDLDEIDLEFIGSNTTHAENNYYGKGNTTDAVKRAKWYPMAEAPQDGFHNYTTHWTKEKLEWYIDGKIVRTLTYDEAEGGAHYPQTPCNVRIGIWAGGDSKNNNYTVDWAGGEIDYDKAPYTMTVKSVRAVDFSTGSKYTYGDNTGTWQSIKIAPGNSTIARILNSPPPKSMKQRWSELPTAAKIGIYASICAFIAITLGLWTLCCIKGRRAGKREGAIADAEFEKDTAELMAWRKKMAGEMKMGTHFSGRAVSSERF